MKGKNILHIALLYASDIQTGVNINLYASSIIDLDT